MHTIKIFLASSAELKDDRLAFENFIGRENKIWLQRDVFFHLDIWEDFIDAISQTRLQDEYNKKIKAADIFVMLFFTKVGMYTSEEFDKALAQFKEAGKPLIYTYFKDTNIKIGKLKRADANSVWDFQEKLQKLGHFKTDYETDSDLCFHFKQQLDKLNAEKSFPFSSIDVPSPSATQIPSCLSAGQPSVPPSFIGRETELADIKQKLNNNKLLLIHAEGGMGKTTLAAKYLTDNIKSYKHFAWLFCDNGINEQIKTLAQPLKVDLTKYKEEADQLLALKTAMQNLGNDCLLVLDNANEPKHIAAFGKAFGGLPWHILLTSRCENVLPPENELTLQHLSAREAKALFKKNQDEQTPEFDQLLDRFLSAIGYNTLMIELFSKNLHELSALGETLKGALQQFEEKGIFLGERSFEVKTAWVDNVHKEAATTDQIIETLYDLTELEEADRQLLVNLALLTAESHLVTLLIEALTPPDKIAFVKQLKELAQKGWLATGEKTYCMNPVVQQIVLAKNKETLGAYAGILVGNLSDKLWHEEGRSLKNFKSYADARPFAELAESVTRFLKPESFDVAFLLLNLSDYYSNIGNHKKWLAHLKKAADMFKNIDKENYGVCLQRLGTIYEKQGDFKKAMEFFEQENVLQTELFKFNPKSENLKYGLAISYLKLGNIHEVQDGLKKALKLFKQFNELSKELFAANPQGETIKNILAISYNRLGINYEKQGNLKKALKFLKQENVLQTELFKANPKSEIIKEGLAISYQRLGIISEKQDNYAKALIFFEQDNKFKKELVATNPQFIHIYHGLAISYARLGQIYKKMQQPEKAKDYFIQAEAIWIELTEKVPEVVDYKNNLEWVQEELVHL